MANIDIKQVEYAVVMPATYDETQDLTYSFTNPLGELRKACGGTILQDGDIIINVNDYVYDTGIIRSVGTDGYDKVTRITVVGGVYSISREDAGSTLYIMNGKYRGMIGSWARNFEFTILPEGNNNVDTPDYRGFAPGAFSIPKTDAPMTNFTFTKDAVENNEILYLCVSDDDPMELERIVDPYTRRTTNDIPLLWGNVTGYSLLPAHPLIVSRTLTGAEDVNCTNVVINLEGFSNFVRGKEVILRSQTIRPVGNGFPTPPVVDTAVGPGVDDFRNFSWYSGELSRNPFHRSEDDYGLVVDITETYGLEGVARCLINYETSVFGFENAYDGDYNDYLGAVSNPSLKAGFTVRSIYGASGDNSMSIGTNTRASGKNSFAQGEYTHASVDNSVALGKWNTSNLDNILEVGVGEAGASANALEITTSGVIRAPMQGAEAQTPNDVATVSMLSSGDGTVGVEYVRTTAELVTALESTTTVEIHLLEDVDVSALTCTITHGNDIDIYGKDMVIATPGSFLIAGGDAGDGFTLSFHNDIKRTDAGATPVIEFTGSKIHARFRRATGNQFEISSANAALYEVADLDILGANTQQSYWDNTNDSFGNTGIISIRRYSELCSPHLCTGPKTITPGAGEGYTSWLIPTVGYVAKKVSILVSGPAGDASEFQYVLFEIDSLNPPVSAKCVAIGTIDVPASTTGFIDSDINVTINGDKIYAIQIQNVSTAVPQLEGLDGKPVFGIAYAFGVIESYNTAVIGNTYPTPQGSGQRIWFALRGE